jgi:hypothetical protein
MGKNESLGFDEISRVEQQMYFFNNTQEVKNGTASYMSFTDKYKAKGVDLVGQYRILPKTATDMQNKFLQSSEHGPMAQFMEIAPLLANKEGRLGRHIQARVTKTAKPDDEGNSFIDLVIELKNDYISELAKENKQYKDVRPTMTLLVDVTTNPSGEKSKVGTLDALYLDKGKKANVLCYENKFGILGLDGAKNVVYMPEKALADIAKKLQTNFISTPGGLSLQDEKSFSREYRIFFLKFLEAVRGNSERNILYLNSKKQEGVSLSKEQSVLLDSYQRVIDFIDAYKNTPGTTE